MSKLVLQSSSVSFSERDMAPITIGTEIERHKVQLSNDKKKAFKQHLNDSIKANAIRNLGLDQILPEAANKTALPYLLG